MLELLGQDWLVWLGAGLGLLFLSSAFTGLLLGVFLGVYVLSERYQRIRSESLQLGYLLGLIEAEVKTEPIERLLAHAVLCRLRAMRLSDPLVYVPKFPSDQELRESALIAQAMSRDCQVTSHNWYRRAVCSLKIEQDGEVTFDGRLTADATHLEGYLPLRTPTQERLAEVVREALRDVGLLPGQNNSDDETPVH